MAVCTFFGHHDCPSTIRQALRTTLIDLIEHSSVDILFVGNHGAFDAMVRSVLSELKQIYPHIRYTIVLAYLPLKSSRLERDDNTNTMLPEGINNVTKRSAIVWRNKWLASGRFSTKCLLPTCQF